MADPSTAVTLADVHASLSAQAPDVRLDREVLGDDRLPDDWAALLGGQALALSQAVVEAPDERGWFRVSGMLDLPVLGRLSATLDVFLVGTDPSPPVQVLLRITDPVTSWTVSDAFPDLPGFVDVERGEFLPSFLHDLALPDVVLVYSSHDFAEEPLDDVGAGLAERAVIDGLPVRRGLNLSGTLDTGGPAWRTVAGMLGLSGRAPVVGSISVQEAGTALALRVPLDGVVWSPAPSLDLAIDAVTITSGLGPGSPDAPMFILDGHIQVHEAVPFSIELAVGDPTVRVICADSDHPLTIHDAVTALGLDPAIVTAIPDGVDSVGLAGLELDVGLAPVAVRSIRLAVVSSAPIPILGDLITVAPALMITAADPFGGDALWDVVLSGRWILGTSALATTWWVSTGTVGAELVAGGMLDVDALLTDLLPGGPPIHVGLSGLELSGSTHTQGFTFRLTADDALRLPIGPAELAVSDVVVEVSRANRAADLHWRLGGSLALAGVHLLVQAERSDAGGWLIDARGGADGSLDLAGLMNHLIDTIHGPGQGWPAGLPEGYASLSITEVVVHYDSSDATLQVYADLAMDIEVVHGLAFTHLTTSAEFDDEGLVEAWITAGLRLGGVDVTLESRFSEKDGLRFSGGIDDGATIPLGHILRDVAELVGVDGAVPAILDGLLVDRLNVSYGARTKDLSIHVEGDLPGTTDVRIRTSLELIHAVKDGVATYTRHLHGELVIGDLHLDVDFAADPSVATLVAAYRGDADIDLSLGSVLAGLDADLAGTVPDQLTVGIREVLLIHQRAGTGNRTIMGMALATDIDLTGLPVVGAALTAPLGLTFEPIYVSADHTAAELAALSPLIGTGPIQLPADDIDKGLHLETQFTAGSQTWRMGLPVELSPGGTPGTATGPPPSTPAVPSATAGSVKWFAIGKAFGPARLQRVGLGFQDGTFSASVDGSVTLGPLTLDLMGLTASASLDDLVPTFSLHGLGLDYHNGDFEVGGAFLHQEVVRNGVTEDEYAGRIVLKTSSFALSAVGLYSQHAGHPSLFIYGVLNRPIGGPTCFFVTGLAVGMGYNRELVMPPITGVADFPLIQEATGTLPAASSLGEEMARLGDAIPPNTGAMFVVAGVRFTSFKLIDSFVLVAVQFGHRLEIDVLGVSRAVIPPPEEGVEAEPLALIELAIRARYVPDEGTVEVRAQLTKASFLLSRDCTLHGAFAFNAWFGAVHNGDFVVTLGGYHPHYVPPSHYPVVPRLGFTWQVDPHLLIEGNAYFALTPSTLMAGAHLDATWEKGALEAWFRAGIDFLIAWKPYHYEASLSVAIGGSYTYEFVGTHHLTFSLSAEMEIWGPPFAGTATIDLYVASVTVRFGSPVKPPPALLDWTTFSKSFLPPAAETCGIDVVDGLLRTLEVDAVTYHVVDPTHLRVRVSSRIPIKELNGKPAAVGQGAGGGQVVVGQAPGIGPVGIDPGLFHSDLSLELMDEGQSLVGPLFDQFPVLSDVPAALWGTVARPGLHDPLLVPGAVVGYDISPINPHPPAHSAELVPKDVAFETDVQAVPTPVESPGKTWIRADFDQQHLATRLADADDGARRRSLIASLRLPVTVDAQPALHPAEDLLEAPHVWLAADRLISEVA